MTEHGATLDRPMPSPERLTVTKRPRRSRRAFTRFSAVAASVLGAGLGTGLGSALGFVGRPAQAVEVVELVAPFSSDIVTKIGRAHV